MIFLKEVSKSFGDKQILHSINLEIKPNEITFIVGSSGAGKSTLLNLIGGLDTVSSGKIFYDNKDITNNLTEYRAKNVGFIFQDYNLVSGLSVRKNIELGLLYADMPENISDIDAHIDMLDIKDQNQSVETLSGGEKQRVAIIRSICKKSDIIIADEPTGNLDSTNAMNVFENLVSMKQDKHIVIVSHDLEMANKYADRIITLSDGSVIEDIYLTKATECSHTSIPKKIETRKINWRTVFILGRNSLRMKLSKILSISLVLALAISALAIVFDFNNLGNSVSKNVNVNYLENDLVSIFYPNLANTAYKQTPFTNDNINHIRSTYEVNEIIPIYAESDTWFFNNQSLMKDTVIKQININEFFKERIMSYEIEGDFIKNDNEIILASDVAKELFTDNCIGKEISLNNGNGDSISFTIVGINKTVNPSDKIYSIVSSMKIKELLVKELDLVLQTRLSLNEFKETKTIDAITVNTGGIYAPMSQVQGTESCLYGQLPQSDNEIMISSALLFHALRGFNIQSDYTEDTVNNGTLSTDTINELLSKKIALNHNGLFQLRISGIYSSAQIEMRFQSQLIEELKKIEPCVLEAYMPQNTNINQIKDTINSTEEFTCTMQLENLKNNISQQTSFFKLAIILIGLIMLLVSVAMLSSFSKITVLERKKEIAIIKSLGATDKDVLFTLWFDAVAISLISIFISLIITGLFITLLPYVITDISFLEFRYPYIPLIILGFCFTIFVCFYTLISMRKLVRKMPAELSKQ